MRLVQTVIAYAIIGGDKSILNVGIWLGKPDNAGFCRAYCRQRQCHCQ